MNVLVTGAAGGIGGGVASALAAAGHRVVGVDVDRPGLDALPDAVETHALDLRDGEAVTERLGGRPFDRVVSCVGAYEIAAVEETTVDSFRRQIDTNLTAVHGVVRATLPALRERGGRIVVVGSMLGGVSLPYHGAYSAAKAGLRGYVDALRREVESRGVTVALVEPGPVRTGLNERAAEEARERAERHPDGPYADAYRSFAGYAPAATSVDAVVDRVVVAATTDRPRTRYRVSRRARWLPRVTAVLPDRLADRLVRAGLPGRILARLIDR
ncbi:dehydrogenase [Halorubrum aidingense JCM 13560]|uniref:Dehydrogenase n=1 Tax=Halorubrum aidingense JCM 13560 TaxID=1230454 RepID=M0PE29_9EURY|nr:SDR family NAD(P)-dependent oxidoreductase [Halorubrum aidingense]EMA67804.1 dehydrogenase [Halorubrum aidingense JCM 13560]